MRLPEGGAGITMRYRLNKAALLRLLLCAMCFLAVPSFAQDSAQPPPVTVAALAPSPVAGDQTSNETAGAQAQSAAESTPGAAVAPEPSRPRAPSVDLDEPVPPPSTVTTADTADSVPGAAAADREERSTGEPFVLLGMEVPPATSTRLTWMPTESFEGVDIATPVLVVNGRHAGPTLCISAAVHGDELNGIEIARRVMYNLDPEKLSGTVVGVPIVNLQGFHRNSRYLPDRRDLNRFFPGNPTGSSASRIAYSFFHEIISNCDALVDLHTGSFHRTNLPQLRADLTHPEVMKLSRMFGDTITLHSDDQPGTLRQAAVEAGIPAVTLEAGEPMRLQEDAVEHGVRGIRSLLHNMDMYRSIRFWRNEEPIFYKSVWVRANSGGILLNTVDLGDKVDKGETLGTVTDPITNVSTDITAPNDGRILGMALNQVVLPGFAAYRIGMPSSTDKMSEFPGKAKEAGESDLRDVDQGTGDDDVEEDDLALSAGYPEPEVSE